MKYTPIIMSGTHPQLIIDGTKTMTRRAIKPQPKIIGDGQINLLNWKGLNCGSILGNGQDWLKTKCPYGQVGDRLFMTQGASSSKSIPFKERFWSRIIKFDDHWEWMGKVNRKKYGVIRWEGKEWATHRLMWQLQNADIPIPDGVHILHKCDMPWCVNPEHLYAGTNDDNIRDKMERGRLPHSRGEDNGQASLTSEQVIEIRSLYFEQWIYQREIAKKFNISQSEVSRIVNSKRWFAESEYPEKETGHRTLEITEVRVERVQEITSGDCLLEGLDKANHLKDIWQYTIMTEYRNLWYSLNAKRGYSWESSPWVWVISFKRLGAV